MTNKKPEDHGSNTPRNENSYEASANEPSQATPDIQQPGKAGDFGNGPAPVGKEDSPAPKKRGPANQRAQATHSADPAAAAEPKNSYSGT